MQLDLKQIKPIIRHRSFIPTFIVLVLDFLLVCSLIFAGYATYQKFTAYEQLKLEIIPQKETATLIQNNKALLSRSIESYNELLNRLVPNEETYFIVIAALEKLASETGVTIGSYNINLSETTEEKLSLELSVYGNPENIETLIREYNYAGGRLMTNEGIQLTFDEQGQIGFSVNVFHRAYSGSSSVEGGEVVVTREDLDKLDKIKARIK